MGFGIVERIIKMKWKYQCQIKCSISKQNGRKNNRISGSSSQVKNAETRARKTREKGKDYSHNWVKYVGKIKAP